MGNKIQSNKSSSFVSFGDALFTKTQQGVMSCIFGNPERTFYVSELIKLVSLGNGAVQRELKRMTDSGLVTMKKIGNQTHYQANNQCPIFSELVNIVKKSFGIAKPISDALQEHKKQIYCAFIFGSIAKHQDVANSDIDLFVISNTITHGDMINQLHKTEVQIGRTINISIYTKKEISKQKKEGNAFICRVLQQSKIWIVGSEGDLPT
jgi:predicted nucleotidyltransferase